MSLLGCRGYLNQYSNIIVLNHLSLAVACEDYLLEMLLVKWPWVASRSLSGRIAIDTEDRSLPPIHVQPMTEGNIAAPTLL